MRTFAYTSMHVYGRVRIVWRGIIGLLLMNALSELGEPPLRSYGRVNRVRWVRGGKAEDTMNRLMYKPTFYVCGLDLRL